MGAGGEKDWADKLLLASKGEVYETEAEFSKVKGEVLRFRKELGSVKNGLRHVSEEWKVTAGDTEGLRRRVL